MKREAVTSTKETLVRRFLCVEAELMILYFFLSVYFCMKCFSMVVSLKVCFVSQIANPTTKPWDSLYETEGFGNENNDTPACIEVVNHI